MNIGKILIGLIIVLSACALSLPAITAIADSQSNDNLLFAAKETGGFNDCEYQFQNNTIKIFAKDSTDPGVFFQKIDMDVSKYKYFTFAIKGNLIREGQWCFPVVQLYDANDDEYTPSITKTSFSLKQDDFTTVSVPLDGKVKNLYKIQFILVTDKGSWDIEVKDPHLE